MNFEQEINKLENLKDENDYLILKGSVPILFSAPHTMYQLRDDGTTKSKEPYTKAIALYLNKYFNTYAIIKNNDTGIDSNRNNYDQYNVEMRRLIKDHNIKLVIDLHGASKDREFDIEFGTLNNLSADFSTIKELEEAFTENDISNISYLLQDLKYSYGYIICEAELIDCIYMTKEYIEDLKNNNFQEYLVGKYEEGRYAWILDNVKLLENKIEVKGKLGIWNYEKECDKS